MKPQLAPAPDPEHEKPIDLATITASFDEERKGTAAKIAAKSPEPPKPWDMGPVPTWVDAQPSSSAQGHAAVVLSDQTPTGIHVVYLSPQSARTLAAHLMNAAREAEISADRKAGLRQEPLNPQEVGD